jgi:NitT/TauT family transport system substrate-binding protein
MTVKKLKIEGSSAIFSLPYFVAQEEGYFAAEGLDIEITRNIGYWSTSSEDIELLADHKSVNAFGAFSAFEKGESSLYRACEWGQIRRSHDSGRNGRVIAKRAAVASQAIVVRPGSPYNTPQDLANVAIGVSFHHGSHYLAIQTLEGFLSREEIKVVGIKNGNRLLALRDGLVDAVAVMEPWTTVAEKLGFKIIAEAHYSGSEIAGPDLDAGTFAAINRAVSRAVTKINVDIRPYLHYFIEEVPPEIVQLEAGDFRLNRLRFVEPAPYPEDAFERTYGWMVSWDLIPPDAGFEQIVDNRLVASAH